MDTKQGCTLHSSEMWHKWPSRRRTRGKRNSLPKHIRLCGIWETMGLCRILHSTLETGKCGHDLTFKSALHLVRELYAPFLKRKRKNYKSLLPPVMAGSSTRFEKKQPIQVRREWKNTGSVTYLDRIGLVFVLLLSEASKQGRAGGFH